MDNENTSLVKLTWFDKIFKPQIITLPNGHSTMRRRSRMPLILLLLLVAIYLSLKMTGFDMKLIITRFDKLLDLFVKLFHPKWEFFNKVVGPLVDTIKMSILGTVIGCLLALPIAVLASICLVVTALLAYINSVTSPIILAAELKAAEEARMEVMEGATSFEEIDSALLPEGVTEAYEADNGGYVFLMTTKGYGGDIKMICGILDDKITKVETLSHSETSGIGSKVVDNNSGYSDNYIGKTAEDYESVDGITGATISSTAYKKALESAFEAYEAVKEAN